MALWKSPALTSKYLSNDDNLEIPSFDLNQRNQTCRGFIYLKSSLQLKVLETSALHVCNNFVSAISQNYCNFVSSKKVPVCVCKCVCVCVCVRPDEGFICLDQLDYQGTDRRSASGVSKHERGRSLAR